MNVKEAYWTKNRHDAIECQRHLINKGYFWGTYGTVIKPEYTCDYGTLYIVDSYDGEIYYGQFSLREAKEHIEKVIVFKSSRIELMKTE